MVRALLNVSARVAKSSIYYCEKNIYIYIYCIYIASQEILTYIVKSY